MPYFIRYILNKIPKAIAKVNSAIFGGIIIVFSFKTTHITNSKTNRSLVKIQWFIKKMR